jgi:hypothetical protein
VGLAQHSSPIWGIVCQEPHVSDKGAASFSSQQAAWTLLLMPL